MSIYLGMLKFTYNGIKYKYVPYGLLVVGEEKTFYNHCLGFREDQFIKNKYLVLYKNVKYFELSDKSQYYCLASNSYKPIPDLVDLDLVEELIDYRNIYNILGPD